MPLEYTNRKGEKYYLHIGATKTGKPKYFLALHSRGPLADAVPEGFEIYENPNGLVSLRKILAKLISDEEVGVVERELGRIARLEGCLVDRKLKVLTVYLVDRKEDLVRELGLVMPWRLRTNRGFAPPSLWSYDPQLQFLLIDEKKRLFQTRRYCYLGSIDDWMDIGETGPLPKLAKLFITHLGQESYYELF